MGGFLKAVVASGRRLADVHRRSRSSDAARAPAMVKEACDSAVDGERKTKPQLKARAQTEAQTAGRGGEWPGASDGTRPCMACLKAARFQRCGRPSISVQRRV